MKEYKGKIMTVNGPIEPSELGPTLTHEHLFFNLDYCYYQSKDPELAPLFDAPLTLENLYIIQNNLYINKDNCVSFDLDLAKFEVGLFKKNGGRSIVDLTAGGKGFFTRPYKHLKEIADTCDINVIGNVGCHKESGHPEYIKDGTADDVADVFLNEIRNGIQNSGMLPGIIGEIGTNNTISENEKKVLRGAARAHLDSGLPISVHVQMAARRGHEILDIFKEEGVDLTRVVLCHQDAVLCHRDLTHEQQIAYYQSLANRGCYIEFDLLGCCKFFKADPPDLSWWMPSDQQRAQAIKELCNLGFSNQILLSHDCAHKVFMASYGGWGIGHAMGPFTETMLEEGVDPAYIFKFFNDNPARMLTIK